MRGLRSMPRMIPALILSLLIASTSIPARASEWEPLPLWGGWVHLAAGGDPAIVYALGRGHLFESHDGGRSWQLVASGTGGLYSMLGNGGVLKVDPQNSSALYLTDADPWGTGQGLLRSEDGGRTWVRSDEGMAGLGVFDLEFGPAASGVLYAGTSGGLYRSKDRGVTWSRLAFAGQWVRRVAVAPSDPRVVLASGSNSKTDWTARSTDRGRTFVRVLKRGVERFAFDPLRPRRVVGTMRGGDDRIHVVRSEDLGARWKILSPLPGSLKTLEFTPAGALLGSSELGGLSQSVDGGATWSLLLAGRDGLPLDVVSSLVILDGGILAGGERGVWRSGKAGRIWRPSNQGIRNEGVEVLKVAADADSTLWLGNSTGLFSSRDQGETFQMDGEGMGPRGRVRRLALHPADPETAYAIGCCVDPWGLSTPGMLKTEDGGRSWRALPYPGAIFDVPVLEIDPVDPDIVYTGGFNDLTPGRFCTAWRSMDGGETWVCIAPPGLDFVGVAVDPRDGRILYGLFNGDLYRSDDRGASWTQLGDTDFLIWGIKVDPFQEDRLYATSNGFYQSDDGGRTWSKLSIGGYIFDPDRPGRIWGFQADRILRSDDAGKTWTDVGSRLGPDGLISFMALDLRSEIFYGAGPGGVYRLRLSGP